MPYKCTDKRIDKWSKDTLDELMQISTLEKKEKNEPLVEIVPTLYLTNSHKGPTVEDFKNFDAKDYFQQEAGGGGGGGGGGKSPLPAWTQDSRLAFQHLTIDMLGWQNQVLKLKIPSIDVMKDAGYTHAWLFRPPIVDAPRMLMDMLNEIKRHPLVTNVNVEMGNGYQSIDEMIQDAHDNGCDALANCTGLGSAKLCKDENLIGGRGVLLHYERNCDRKIDDESMEHDAAILVEDAPWGSSTDPAYVIPRGNVFVVGGTYYENNTETKLSENERKRLVENADLLGIDTSITSPVSEWAGFRPVRQTVRMEIDEKSSSESKLRIVHSYGHGGSGWTTYVGAAKEVAELLCS